MFSQLAQHQAAVANAILDWAEAAAGWRAFFLHAEFADGAALLEAFLVLAPPAPTSRRSVPVEGSIAAALRDLYAAYQAAGQAFTQLDLTVFGPDGRYRYELGHAVPLRLTGAPDPDAVARLDRRYRQLVHDLGLAPPAAAPSAPDQARRPRPSLRPVTAANLASAVAAELASAARHLAYAARAEAEGRPRIAGLFRAAAKGDDVRARFHRSLLGADAPAATPGPATRAGTTLDNLTATIDAETVAATELYPPMIAAESGKAQDLFYVAKAGLEGRAWLFGVALERLTAGEDLGGDEPYFVCAVCGALECAHPGTCSTCERSTEFVTVT